VKSMSPLEDLSVRVLEPESLRLRVRSKKPFQIQDSLVNLGIEKTFVGALRDPVMSSACIQITASLRIAGG
jgi:hypothetical protein